MPFDQHDPATWDTIPWDDCRIWAADGTALAGHCQRCGQWDDLQPGYLSGRLLCMDCAAQELNEGSNAG